jgi:hypothetical protein
MSEVKADTDFEVIDPKVAAEVHAISREQRQGDPHFRGRKPSERTKALLDGATVFIPGSKSRANWSGWYRKTMSTRKLRVRQLYAEYQGQTGHFVWCEPVPEGSAE